MSHFTVMVVGDDVEYQLAPFHEFECTGVNDEFVQEIDNTAEVQKEISEQGFTDGLEWFGLHNKTVTSESEVDRNGQHKYGFAIVSGETLIKSVDRTNPNKKWDWYQVGGRWAGEFYIKPEFAALYRNQPPNFSHGWSAEDRLASLRDGLKVDSAIKAHIDFERKIRKDNQEAAKKYTVAYADIFRDLPPNKPWPVVRGECASDATRDEYWKQPRCVAWKEYMKAHSRDKELPFDSFFGSPDEFLCTLDQYVNLASRKAITTFAFLRNRKWAERGNMGWFGCVSNENDSWEDVFHKLLADVPDTERLTVVDCHI